MPLNRENKRDVLEALSHNGGGDWLCDPEMWVPAPRMPLDERLGAFAGMALEAAVDNSEIEPAVAKETVDLKQPA